MGPPICSTAEFRWKRDQSVCAPFFTGWALGWQTDANTRNVTDTLNDKRKWGHQAQWPLFNFDFALPFVRSLFDIHLSLKWRSTQYRVSATFRWQSIFRINFVVYSRFESNQYAAHHISCPLQSANVNFKRQNKRNEQLKVANWVYKRYWRNWRRQRKKAANILTNVPNFVFIDAGATFTMHPSGKYWRLFSPEFLVSTKGSHTVSAVRVCAPAYCDSKWTQTQNGEWEMVDDLEVDRRQ